MHFSRGLSPQPSLKLKRKTMEELEVWGHVPAVYHQEKLGRNPDVPLTYKAHEAANLKADRADMARESASQTVSCFTIASLDLGKDSQNPSERLQVYETAAQRESAQRSRPDTLPRISVCGTALSLWGLTFPFYSSFLSWILFR